MRGSNAWQKMSVAKGDRRRYRLENENVDEKCRRAKNRESRSRQRQWRAAEHRAAGLTARRCDVRLTSTWFEVEVCGNRFFVPIPSHFNDFIPIPI